MKTSSNEPHERPDPQDIGKTKRKFGTNDLDWMFDITELPDGTVNIELKREAVKPDGWES